MVTIMKKFCAVSLSLLLISQLTACQSTQPENEVTTTSGAPSADTTADEDSYEPAAGDLGGDTFTILNTSQTYNFYSYLDFEEATGETLDDAIYERNRAVEELYNFTLEIVEYELEAANTALSTAVLAGDDSYDAAFLRDYYLKKELTDGYLMNIDTIPEMRLDEPWWDGAVTEESRLGKSRQALFAMTDVSLCDFEGTLVTFINENMLTDLGLDAPYDLVREGKWTFDKLVEYMKAGANLNGDDSFTLTQDGNAVYGMVSYQRFGPGMLAGAGIDSAYIDEDGRPQISYSGDLFFDYCDKLKSAMSVAGEYLYTNTGTVNDYTHYENVFKSGRALMTLAQLKAANNYRDMTDAYGILPVPKYDESQDSYHCLRTYTYLLCIPVTNSRPHETGAIMDAMSYYTYRDIMPSFYEERVSQKLLRGEDSIDMLEIVRESRKFDVGSVLNIFLPLADNVIDACLRSNTELASKLASTLPSIEATIDSLMESIDSGM